MKKIFLSQYLCKSHFALKYDISRKVLDRIISEDLLPTAEIDSLIYIDISDEKVIQKALNSRPRTGKRGMIEFNTHNYNKMSENDAEFEKSWRESQGM
jgi:hypothetical protein